jgi:hypothetical protein
VSLKTRGLLRQLILVAICALGTLGILASGSSGGGDGGEDGSCDLSIQGIAPAVDGSGHIWVGVLSKTSEGDYHSVSRLRSDGTEKASYAFGYAAGENLVKTVAIATDALNANKVYVGGDFAGGILRLNEDGSPDASFVVGVGFDGRVTSIVPAADGTGDVYVGGSFSSYGATLNISGLVRLDSDGSLDSLGFTAAPIAVVEGIALAADGLYPDNLYSAGISGTSGVARWSETGIRDNSFKPPISRALTVTAAADTSGAIYVGSTASIGVVRVNRFGSPDGSFITGAGFNSDVLSIVRADDGTKDIYAGGRFTVYDGASAKGIVRLKSTGLPADGFSTGDGFTNSSNDPDPLSQVYSLARAPDGTDIYVGGGFAFYNGIRSNGIVRLNDNGSVDSNFAVEIAAEKGLCHNDTILSLD